MGYLLVISTFVYCIFAPRPTTIMAEANFFTMSLDDEPPLAPPQPLHVYATPFVDDNASSPPTLVSTQPLLKIYKDLKEESKNAPKAEENLLTSDSPPPLVASAVQMTISASKAQNQEATLQVPKGVLSTTLFDPSGPPSLAPSPPPLTDPIEYDDAEEQVGFLAKFLRTNDAIDKPQAKL